ncbi:MAG TPA: hypothetical protein VD835_07715 [Pyrinomonadaceae bacterium]|nr:hypothetical protein [Pyrinomonadaceae bacterium]
MNPDWVTAAGIFGTLASVMGLIYAWVVARRSDRKKKLTYDVNYPLELASVLPDRIEHRLSITYERVGAEPVNIKGAYLWLITLGNLGKEPIRREDIAPSDRLRVVIRNAKVLDIAKAGITREVINFDVVPFEEKADGLAESIISFDFLDYRDAASIRVLTDSAEARITVQGTIIGMPEGIKAQDELGTLHRFPFLRRHYGIIWFFVWLVLALTISIPLITLVAPYLLEYAHESLIPIATILCMFLGVVLSAWIIGLFESRVARRVELPTNLPLPKD